ncbi:methionine ABC transporter permease [Paenibacillus alvei]|uniref:methionine ABC transporter permease n=1 Tax=Paenibacillus alvei TaxID=44250 RepID=UPI002280248B|nr:methionine ABC transporter permease [Paenibacillus alvei]MBG9734192.1 methionine ABC transporter permease [Paenibacillus alvei]MBG9744557.1 methionine ABC transporter permease [Paenibacillus alvei]MCY9581754.1 ABC transporter permease [Paenibacillus alvei]MCY9588377.1 ABC transporter permease [Paenibacillus alvei]
MSEFLMNNFPNIWNLREEILISIYETIYMVVVTSLFSVLFGLLLGVTLIVVDKGGILENRLVYSILDKIINLFRSIPFIILIAVVVPLTRLIAGTSIGMHAAIVPLVIGIVPFYARQIQNALVEVDPGIVEAAQSMGSGPIEIVFRVYLKEGLNAIVRASSVTVINLIGLTTMAGAIGSGGLGSLAISKGYNRFQNDITIVATILILILVFVCQFIGDYFTKKTMH